MKRWGVAVTTALLAGVGLLGLAGCGAAGDAAQNTAQEAAVEVAAGMGAEGQALAAMGFDTEAIAAAEPTAQDPMPSAEPNKGGKDERLENWRKRHLARVLLRRNTLHGEAVVRTKEGIKTVVVQRGTVTAISGDSMTVKSTDGFTMTWTFGPNLRVVERRASVQPSEVKVGAELGVAGAKDGDKGVARLIVISNKK